MCVIANPDEYSMHKAPGTLPFSHPPPARSPPTPQKHTKARWAPPSGQRCILQPC